MKQKKYVMFDWAAKHLLRDKSDFTILEGFVQVLTGRTIHIEEILESESNQEDAGDKFNRVDIKAKDSNGDIIIVEIQLTRELDFLQRILYGVAKSLTEHINMGDSYGKIKKVISISVLYFDLGEGSDYLYHGQTVFTGVNSRDELKMSSRERTAIELKTPKEIFPEYYLVRVNEFNKALAGTPLEEWLCYLKTGEVRDDAMAPGLEEVRRKLEYMNMSDEDQARYRRHLDAVNTQMSVLEASRREGRYDGLVEGLEQGRTEGFEKGRAEGREEGRAEGRAEGREEGRAEGREEGRAEGREEGRAEGREEGRAEGREEGRAEGREEGRAEGREEGRAEAVLEIVRRLKQEGTDLEQISRYTGFSVGEIKSLDECCHIRH